MCTSAVLVRCFNLRKLAFKTLAVHTAIIFCSSCIVILSITSTASVYLSDMNELHKMTVTRCEPVTGAFWSPYSGQFITPAPGFNPPLQFNKRTDSVSCWVPVDGGNRPVWYGDQLPAGANNPTVGMLLSYDFQRQLTAAIVLLLTAIIVIICGCVSGVFREPDTTDIPTKDLADGCSMCSMLLMGVSWIFLVLGVTILFDAGTSASKAGTCAWVRTTQVQLVISNDSTPDQAVLVDYSSQTTYNVKPSSKLLEAMSTKTNLVATCTVSDTGLGTPLFSAVWDLDVPCVSGFTSSGLMPSSSVEGGHIAPELVVLGYFLYALTGCVMLCSVCPIASNHTQQRGVHPMASKKLPEQDLADAGELLWMDDIWYRQAQEYMRNPFIEQPRVLQEALNKADAKRHMLARDCAARAPQPQTAVVGGAQPLASCEDV